MLLQSLQLEYFRSYEKMELSFGGGITVFSGPNASGKTNLLEAIAVLSYGSSPVAVEEADLYRWGCEHYRIAAKLQKDSGEDVELEIVSQIKPRKAKAVRMNGVKKHISDVMGILPIVLFLPSDLELFTGSPDLRRRFLNTLLCQVSPHYRLALDEYRRVLKQRNALLKKYSGDRLTSNEKRVNVERALAPWDLKVAELGAQIILERKQLVATLNLSLKEELKTFGEEMEKAQIEYRHNGKASLIEELKEELHEELKRVHERDIILQATTIGPHRDDWSLLLDGKDVVTFASRGQQRAAVLALLTLQASYLELKMNEKPVLLLDDVFSELDEEHEEAVLNACNRYQTLITATHLPERLPEDVSIRECPMDVNLQKTVALRRVSGYPRMSDLHAGKREPVEGETGQVSPSRV